MANEGIESSLTSGVAAAKLCAHILFGAAGTLRHFIVTRQTRMTTSQLRILVYYLAATGARPLCSSKLTLRIKLPENKIARQNKYATKYDQEGKG